MKNKIEIYADGITPEPKYIAHVIDQFGVSGFTCNPTLVKKHTLNYYSYCKTIIDNARGLPVSIQVLSDIPLTSFFQAQKIASWGENVFVKIPVINSAGISNIPLIKRLLSQEIKVNITAIFNADQVNDWELINNFNESDVILSVFAGRIYDLMTDPILTINEIKEFKSKNHKILWAGCRSPYDLLSAKNSGCDIITIPELILNKMASNKGKSKQEYCIETVQMFHNDAKNFTI